MPSIWCEWSDFKRQNSRQIKQNVIMKFHSIFIQRRLETMAKGENIYKRKDGRWEGRYKKGYDENKKIKYGYCYGHSYRETKEKLNRVKAEFYLNPTTALSHESEKSFSAYCIQWLKINENRLKSSTLTKYETMLKNHIIPSVGNYQISHINSNVISDFSNELLQKKHLSAKTTQDILTFIHEIIVYIQSDAKNNFPSIMIAYPAIEQEELRILSNEEQQYFMEFLLRDMDIYKFSVLLALWTGLRIGEICGLQWKYISTDNNLLSVRNTVLRVKNRDSFSSQKTTLQLGSPKTKSSVRTIPFTDSLSQLFQRFQTNDPDTFVVSGSRQMVDPRKLQRRLKKYTTYLGLEDVHFHTLRHTFATRCIELGCDVKTLSKILGHSSISTTMNRYVHPSIDLKRENIKKLEQAGLFPPSK